MWCTTQVEDIDMDPGRGMSWVVNQSRVVTMNHRHDLTDSAQGEAPHENRSAGVPIPAALSNNQCGVLWEEDDQFRQEIVRAIPVQMSEVSQSFLL